MNHPGRRRVLVAALAGLAATACLSAMPVDQRTSQGPTAREMWIYRVASETGRQPSFEERQHWEDNLERRVDRFLAQHPEIANSFEIATFRNTRQVAVGMTREQVLLLLGPPIVATTDPAKIEELARRFWPQMKDKATEAWVYPLGWRVYFGGPRVVDITQYVPRLPF